MEAKSLLAVAAMFSVVIIRARAQQEVMVSPIVTMVSCETRDFMEEDLEARRFETLAGRAFVYNGSRLNNGRESITSTDRECLSLCAKTPGCRAWTRNTKSPSEGECWLHAALPEPRQSPNQNSGRVQLKEATLASCEGMKSVGFQRAVAYAILNTISAGECCARCREDSKLCHAWMFVESEKGCHFFGNEVPTSKEIPCRDCTSGKRKVTKGDEEGCKDSEILEGRVFNGFFHLAPGDAFLTKTSKECCRLCKNIRECRSWTWRDDSTCQLNADVPNSATTTITTQGGVQTSKSCGDPSSTEQQCRFEKGIETFGGDEYHPWIPSGKHLKIPTPEGCCAVCEGIPECTTWTFTRGKEGQVPFSCWIKFDVPGAQNIKAEEEFNQSVSGVVPSRVSSTQLKEFDTAVEEARKNAPKPPGTANNVRELGEPGDIYSHFTFEEPPGAPPGAYEDTSSTFSFTIAVAVSVAVFVLLVLCCIIGYTCYVYGKKKQKEEFSREDSVKKKEKEEEQSRQETL